MAKRFPVPEFEYVDLKARPWQAPPAIDAVEAARLTAAARGGDASAYGAYPIACSDAFASALALRGEHRHAMLCLTPGAGVTMTGRSHAWKVQRVLAVDAVDGGSPAILADWKTPRPMNTRLGPEHGIPVPAGALYLVFAHMYADYWVPNRVDVDDGWAPERGNGFRVLSSDDVDMNDFHHAVVSFAWGG